MVAIMRLEGYENWSICDIFLKNQPEDEQEAIAIQTVIRCKGKIHIFQICPTRCFIA